MKLSTLLFELTMQDYELKLQKHVVDNKWMAITMTHPSGYKSRVSVRSHIEDNVVGAILELKRSLDTYDTICERKV